MSGWEGVIPCNLSFSLAGLTTYSIITQTINNMNSDSMYKDSTEHMIVDYFPPGISTL